MGENDRPKDRASARDVGPADTEDAGAGAGAWLGDFRAHPSSFQQNFAGAARVAPFAEKKNAKNAAPANSIGAFG